MKKNRYKISFGLGCFSALLGAVVLISWFIGWEPLIQVSRSFVPMQANTSMGFLMCGIALLLACLSKPLISRIIAGVFITFAIATIVEYGFNTDLCIDQLLIEHYIIEKAPYPGRMALNTAICFLLAGVSIIIASLNIKIFVKLFSAGVFSSVVFALSLVAFSGYITGFESSYGWGSYSAMAVHTSWGFIFLSIGELLFLWKNIENRKIDLLFFRPFVIGVCAFTISICLWQTSFYREDAHVEHRVAAEAEKLRNTFTSVIDPHIQELTRMARRWEINGKPSNSDWEKEAKLCVDYYKAFQAIEWVDTDYYVRWIVPLEGNESAMNLNLAFEEKRLKALNTSRMTHTVSASAVIDLKQKGKGFLVYAPVGKGDKFEGFILGVFKLDKLFDNVLKHTMADYVSFKMFEGDKEIYSSAADKTPLFEKFAFTAPFELYNLKWKVATQPTIKLVKEEHSIFPNIVLAICLIISALITFASYISQKARFNAIDLNNVNTLLNIEIRKRKGVAKALRSSDRFVRSVIDNILDGVITIDEYGAILSFNKEAEHIFGYTLEEVTGNNVRMLMPEPDKGNHSSYLNNYLQTGTAKIIGIGREVVGMRKDGSTFPLDLAVSELLVEGKRHFTGIVRDITIQKRAEKGIIRAKEEAEQANRAKTQFLAHMSHDLRTPLNSVLGFSQLLAMDLSKTLTKGQKENVERIEKSGKHLLTLINEILDLSRIESGSLTVELEPIDILKLIVELLAYVKPIASKYGVEIIDQTKDTNPCSITADKTRLKQVILNLLSNAIKYNKENGTVTIALNNVGKGNLRIVVEDTGPGIPEDKQPGLFEPFNRLDADKTDIEGTGIGLTIAKQLTEKMGGAIGLDSVVGKGSRFYVELPCAGSREKEELQSEAGLYVGADSETLEISKFTILYVEDNMQNIKLIEDFLNTTRKNIEVVSARDAKSGIDMAINQTPDLILMDINMPGMNGLEAMEVLKNDDATRNIPVIAISANAMKENIATALQAGFQAYITKPVDLKNFLKEVDKYLKM